MQEEVNVLVEKIRTNRPSVVFIDAKKVERLRDSDCLSLESIIFRNGGSVGGVDAVPFVEATPEMIELLKLLAASIRLKLEQEPDERPSGQTCGTLQSGTGGGRRLILKGSPFS